MISINKVDLCQKYDIIYDIRRNDRRRRPMPRPKKCRRVCCLPQNNSFGPIGTEIYSNEVIEMTVDEYETIRLIDLEGYTQLDCSRQMNIARTTVQSIYDEARNKIAYALVNNRKLVIRGGEYKLCADYDEPCGYIKNCTRYSGFCNRVNKKEQRA